MGVFTKRNGPRPVRVLHLIDGLSGGGAERWACDIVRLSAPEATRHMVVPVHLDRGNFVYADRLGTSGAYERPGVQRLVKLFQGPIQSVAARRKSAPARRLLSLGWRLGCYGTALWRVPKAVLKFNPDVIHAHTFHGFVAGLLVKAATGRPLLHTVPCLFSQMRADRYGWMPGLYRRVHPWVDCFSTGDNRTELLEIGVPASKIMYDLCGVDQEAVGAARADEDRHRAEIRASLGIPADARIALSVGRLDSSKGHLFALEALPTLTERAGNLHWVLLGEGEERAVLEHRAQELGVAGHAHIAGFRPDPLPYYAAADIYLRTPVFEPENLSFYQAMAMGLPSAGFDTGWETDLIRKVGCGLLVPNKDSAALAEAAGRILSLPDGGRAMGELGASYSRRHLSLQQSVSDLSLTYAELCKGTYVARPI